MANFNGAAHIAAAVRSVLEQSERSLELILSDDASSDDSLVVAKEAALGDARLVLLQSEDRGGPAAARNRALAHAKGDWIAIVDNDDFIDTDRLAQLIAHAEADGADIVADNLIAFYDEIPGVSHLHLPPKYRREPLWIGAVEFVRADNHRAGLGYLKPIFRRAAFGAALHYDEQLRIGEDMQLMTQLLSGGSRLRLYPEAGYHYRKRRGSISHRRDPATLDAMIAAIDRIDPRGDAALAQALARRKRALVSVRTFDDIVAAIKARDAAGAIRTILKRPSALLWLRHPIAARLGLRRT
jgi:succinoglycan biosynthesis protein ExoO